MRARDLLAFAVLGAALVPSAGGCVSSATWARRRDAEARLEPAEARDASRAEADGRSHPGAGDDEGQPSRGAPGTCEALAALAVRTHPSLEASRARARAALAASRADGALPAPQARVATWDFPIGDPATADHAGMYMVGLSQTLPPAVALDADARSAVEAAHESLGALDETAAEVGARAAGLCVAWASASARGERLRAWRASLRAMRDAADARLSAGGVTLADLARIEREEAGAARMLARAEADAARAARALRTWLGLPELEGLGPAPALVTDDERDPDRDALLARAQARRGALVEARARIAAAEARARAAEARAEIPTVMLGASYMQMPGARAGLGLEVGIELPWLWSGAGDRAEAARLEAVADRAELAGLERGLETELTAILGELEAARAELAALRDAERPAALRLEAALAAAYRGGGASLLEWLDAARALRELDVEELESLATLAALRVELARLVGGDAR